MVTRPNKSRPTAGKSLSLKDAGRRTSKVSNRNATARYHIGAAEPRTRREPSQLVRRAAKLVARTHRRAYKELEKY